MSDNNKLLPIIMLGIKSRKEEAKVFGFENRTRNHKKQCYVLARLISQRMKPSKREKAI